MLQQRKHDRSEVLVKQFHWIKSPQKNFGNLAK